MRNFFIVILILLGTSNAYSELCKGTVILSWKLATPEAFKDKILNEISHINIDKDCVSSYMKLVNTYVNEGKIEEGIKKAEEMLKTEQDYKAYYNYTLQSLYYFLDENKSIEYGEKALNTKDTGLLACIYNLLAFSYFSLGDMTNGNLSVEKALYYSLKYDEIYKDKQVPKYKDIDPDKEYAVGYKLYSGTAMLGELFKYYSQGDLDNFKLKAQNAYNRANSDAAKSGVISMYKELFGEEPDFK